jgi:hypothetical protein
MIDGKVAFVTGIAAAWVVLRRERLRPPHAVLRTRNSRSRRSVAARASYRWDRVSAHSRQGGYHGHVAQQRLGPVKSRVIHPAATTTRTEAGRRSL